MTGPDRLGLPCPTFSISVCFIHRSHPSYQRQDASPPTSTRPPSIPIFPFTVAIPFFPLPLNVECQDTHAMSLSPLFRLSATPSTGFFHFWLLQPTATKTCIKNKRLSPFVASTHASIPASIIYVSIPLTVFISHKKEGFCQGRRRCE